MRARSNHPRVMLLYSVKEAVTVPQCSPLPPPQLGDTVMSKSTYSEPSARVLYPTVLLMTGLSKSNHVD